MTTTQQHNIRLTPSDWQLVSAYADAANMTPQAWLVNVVIGGWMDAAGHKWQGVGSVGNPQWVAKQDDNRCCCGTAARIVENGITCELCGKDIF